jgi:hypothetical protein
VITYLGSKSVGDCMPLAVQAQASLDAQLASGLPDVEAKLSGLVAVSAALTIGPPELSATITAALDNVAQLQASLSVGGPSVTLQVTAIADMIAEIGLEVAALQAKVAASAAIAATFGAGGIHAYLYTGPADQMGSEMQTALAGGIPGGSPGAEATALVFAATSAPAKAAMSTAFGVSL